jgi:thiamine transport system substrate-binding protein
LEDPRTSTPGLAFLFFTRSVLPDAWEHYWTDISGRWLTLSPGWDQAYGMFLKEEAPFVWSYTTSQAYHRLHGDPDGGASKPPRYRAVIFEDAMPVQVEGAAMVRGLSGPSRKIAERFLEFLLSEEAQALIPEGNWMLPVRAGTPLPNAVFSSLPRPRKWIHLQSDAHALKDILARWNRAVHR